jgi:hypothetical protein
MPDVGSIRFAIMMPIVALTVLTRLLQPCARGALRDEARIFGHPRVAAGGARQVPSTKSPLQRNQ